MSTFDIIYLVGIIPTIVIIVYIIRRETDIDLGLFIPLVFFSLGSWLTLLVFLAFRFFLLVNTDIIIFKKKDKNK